jgi:hypothetical protein
MDGSSAANGEAFPGVSGSSSRAGAGGFGCAAFLELVVVVFDFAELLPVFGFALELVLAARVGNAANQREQATSASSLIKRNFIYPVHTRNTVPVSTRLDKKRSQHVSKENSDQFTNRRKMRDGRQDGERFSLMKHAAGFH